MALPGLEILFCSVQNQLASSQDALVTVFHWGLVSNGLKCIGVGDENTKNETNTRSEMLPQGWNSDSNLYNLCYTNETNKVYILKVIKVDDDLLVHLMESGSEKVTNMNVRTSDFATSDLSSYQRAFKNVDELSKNFKEEIINDVLKNKKNVSSESSRSTNLSQGQRRSRTEDPLRIPPRHTQRPPPEWTDPEDPFNIGRRDLDPFARGQGGGMLFDPMRGGGPRFGPDPSAGLPGRLPPGAVPPGARFDPFGPPGQRPGPDPDHLPPPGYDDMFM